MDAPSTSLERHERGIHALRSGAGGARATKVGFRAQLRPRRRYKLSGIALGPARMWHATPYGPVLMVSAGQVVVQ
jgi:hypothetical protein